MGHFSGIFLRVWGEGWEMVDCKMLILLDLREKTHRASTAGFEEHARHVDFDV